MSVRSIVTKKTRLELVCEDIHDPELITQIIEDLQDTAYHHKEIPPGCVGLAANQIGYQYNIITIWMDDHWRMFVNPSIELLKGPKDYAKEGCLSRPGIQTKKRRHKKVRMTYTAWPNYDDVVIEKYTGFKARVLQHEMDHLIGVYI